MTSSSLKLDQNQLTIFAHPWYEELQKAENTIKCELESTLKQSAGSIGLRSIEWAAGLFEGEGYLAHYKSGQWSIGIKMTDYDCLKYFHDIVKVGYINGPTKPKQAAHYKPYWCWRASKHADIFHVIAEFYPYMCERRRAKFDEYLTTHGN